MINPSVCEDIWVFLSHNQKRLFFELQPKTVVSSVEIWNDNLFFYIVNTIVDITMLLLAVTSTLLAPVLTVIVADIPSFATVIVPPST